MDAGKLVAYLGLNTREFDAKVNQTGNMMRGFANKIAGSIAGFVSIGAIVNFVRESAKIEATYQEIYQGFQRLNDPLLLRDLQSATEGLVDKMTLMKNVVQARNFQVPMEVLATGLRFAKIRADETGQSVEALTEALIMGLGRGSVRSLTQLGIATADVREEMKKTGDFTKAVTNLMERGIASVGKTAESSADKAEKLSAVFKDWRLLIGEGVNPVLDKMRDLLTKAFQGYTIDPQKDAVLNQLQHFKEATLKGKSYEDQIKLLTDAQAGFNQKSKDLNETIAERKQFGWPERDIKPLEKQAELYQLAADAFDQYAKSLENANNAGKPTTGIINGITFQLDLLKEQLGGITSKRDLRDTLIAISEYEKELKGLTDLTPEIKILDDATVKAFRDTGMSATEVLTLLPDYINKISSIPAKQIEVCDSLREVDTSLKKNSASWASYKYTVKDTMREMVDVSQVVGELAVNAVDSLAQSLANLLINTSSFQDFFKNLGVMVADLAIQIGKLLTAIGIGLMIATGGVMGKGATIGGAMLMTAGYTAKGLLERTPGNSASAVSPSNSSFTPSGNLSAQRITVAVTGELDGRKLAIAAARGSSMSSQMS